MALAHSIIYKAKEDAELLKIILKLCFNHKIVEQISKSTEWLNNYTMCPFTTSWLYVRLCIGAIIPYLCTDTHCLSDEDIEAFYYSTVFYERVPVSINYPLQSGALPGSWPLITVVE